MLLSCRKITKSFGDKMVLNNFDIDICRNDRIGLVGRNGAGKTTLANILAGSLDYDRGSIITTRQELNIGYLCQSKVEPEFFLNVLSNETKVNGEFQRLTNRLGINRIHDWSRERLRNLSGGEKTKLALAAVLAAQPDLIILDEPTNHIDYQGVEYLVAELNRFSGAAIIISHDRYFLDSTVTQIAEIENGKIKIYPGNYSRYRGAKQQATESQRHLYQSQQKEQQKINAAISQLRNWSDKAHRESRQKGEGIGGKEYYRKKAKKRDQAIKSQIKRLEKIREEGIARPTKDPRVNFNVNAREKGNRRLLEADSISKAYGKLTLFEDSSFYITRGEKVGVLGPNGCGKTTLVKLILSLENLDEGKLFLSQSARVAYVSQELPRNEKENLKSLVKDWPLEKQKSTFQLLVGMGITYDRLSIALRELSRGERMKIAIGLALMGEYDFLVLDEPTNHLDIYSREALEESLKQYPGAILLISHDRYLLDQVCDRLLVFDNQKIMRIEARVSEYLAPKQETRAKHSSGKAGNGEELLLLETRISWVISELTRYKPGEPDYLALEQEYNELIEQRKRFNRWQQPNF